MNFTKYGEPIQKYAMISLANSIGGKIILPESKKIAGFKDLGRGRLGLFGESHNDKKILNNNRYILLGNPVFKRDNELLVVTDIYHPDLTAVKEFVYSLPGDESCDILNQYDSIKKSSASFTVDMDLAYSLSDRAFNISGEHSSENYETEITDFVNKLFLNNKKESSKYISKAKKIIKNINDVLTIALHLDEDKIGFLATGYFNAQSFDKHFSIESLTNIYRRTWGEEYLTVDTENRFSKKDNYCAMFKNFIKTI